MVPSNFAPLDDLASTYMRHLVDRVRRGDGAASNELLHRAGARLEELLVAGRERLISPFPAEVGRAAEDPQLALRGERTVLHPVVDKRTGRGPGGRGSSRPAPA